MGKNLIPSFMERKGNIISRVANTFAGNLAALNIFPDNHPVNQKDEQKDEGDKDEFKVPSWADMLKNYPATAITTKALYDEIGGGLPASLVKDPESWENSCSIRMSKALNYSNAKLPKAPSKGGTIKGKDGNNYWIRVKDLKKYLVEKLKEPDVEEAGAPGIVDKFKNKKGIIVFDVTGWYNASGHFTIWDGVDLKYVGADTPEHNDPGDAEYYYFNMNYQDTDESGTPLVNDDGSPKIIKTTKIRLWELK
jgi:hypothetical protein